MVLTITYLEYPNILQTTLAALWPQLSLQMVPQVLLLNTSTRPSPVRNPPTSLMSLDRDTSACHKLSKSVVFRNVHSLNREIKRNYMNLSKIIKPYKKYVLHILLYFTRTISRHRLIFILKKITVRLDQLPSNLLRT